MLVVPIRDGHLQKIAFITLLHQKHATLKTQHSSWQFVIIPRGLFHSDRADSSGLFFLPYQQQRLVA